MSENRVVFDRESDQSPAVLMDKGISFRGQIGLKYRVVVTEIPADVLPENDRWEVYGEYHNGIRAVTPAVNRTIIPAYAGFNRAMLQRIVDDHNARLGESNG